MKIKIILYLTLTLLYINAWAQKDMNRNKGFYNITTFSTATLIDASEYKYPYPITPSSSYHNTQMMAAYTSLGFVLGIFGASSLIGLVPDTKPRNPALCSFEVGIGLVRYYQPDLAIVPITIGVRVFFSSNANSLYVTLFSHGTIGKGSFKSGRGFEAGLGYKFFLFDAQCFIVELTGQQRFISMIRQQNIMTSKHLFTISHLTLSVGIMPF